mgnify:CR=1 FL=1
MSIKIKQHIPGFVDGMEPAHDVVVSLEALLALPYVGIWTEGEIEIPPFHQFSIAKPEGLEDGAALLMAEMDKGREWYVVGYLQSDEPINLPIWVNPFG